MKKKGCKRTIFALAVGLGICMVAYAESFYQQYSATGVSGLSVTNVGVNPIFVSGVSCQYGSNVTGAITIKYNDQLLYTVNMVSNSSFLVTKSDLAGIWLKKNDYFTVSSLASTNTIIVSTEENR